jgi:hypothetical protein
MKKLLTSLTLCAVILTGCTTTDTGTFNPVLAENVAKIAGSSTAIVLLAIPKISSNPKIKSAIYEVTTAIESVVPAQDQTYTQAITPVVNATVDKLIAQGKITAEEGSLIKEACVVMASGVDLALAKYPKAKEISANTTLIVKSFMKSFNTVFSGGVLIQNSKDTIDTVSELRKINKDRLNRMVK